MADVLLHEGDPGDISDSEASLPGLEVRVQRALVVAALVAPVAQMKQRLGRPGLVSNLRRQGSGLIRGRQALRSGTLMALESRAGQQVFQPRLRLDRRIPSPGGGHQEPKAPAQPESVEAETAHQG